MGVWRLLPCVILPFSAAAGCRDGTVPREPHLAAPPGAAEEAVPDEARAEAIRLQRELGEGYRCAIEGPFIVLGNVSEDWFERIVEYTIRDCSALMTRQFFDRKPEYGIKVYLFANASCYEGAARRLWGDEGVPHYGYYKSAERALVMNIGTGTGTLVHEMFHALVESDFPDIPAWFNEGAASLYEQCRLEPGRLVGLMNWRFPALRDAAAGGGLVPLKDLVSTTTRRFYGPGSGLHYAEARYFCMYLQEKGLLERYYRMFRDDFGRDPTGKVFLEELLGKDMDGIEGDWVAWVKTLRYPR